MAIESETHECVVCTCRSQPGPRCAHTTGTISHTVGSGRGGGWEGASHWCWSWYSLYDICDNDVVNKKPSVFQRASLVCRVLDSFPIS